MITVIVKYRTPKHYSQQEIEAMMRQGAEHQFLGLPHLYSKQFCFDIENSSGLSVYLWSSKQHAEAFFSQEFLDNFKQVMGTTPSIEYYNTVVTVDNRQGDILLNDEA